MRVIEPRRPNRRTSPASPAKILIFCLVAIAGIVLFALWHHKTSAPAAPHTNTAAKPPVATPARTTLKTFTSDQFKALYSTYAYPNTTEITDPPVITGNTGADQRIQGLALQRGYKLRSLPRSPMPSYEGYTFQQKAVDDYKKLEKAAHDASMPLTIVAAFRSPEDARDLFLSRMSAAGITVSAVAAGTADSGINQLLATTGIPGYSRHHTGYTMDLGCDGFELFVTSPCYGWLSANNFANAKTYGWIPSYPDGATDQGPEPEPWEFVWVGTDVLYQ